MLSKTALQKLILTSNNITNSQRTNRKYEIHTGFELFLATSINSCLLTTVLLFIYWAFYNEQKTAWPTAVHHIISNRIQRRSLLCRRRRVLLHTSTKEYVMSVALLWQQHYNFKWKSDQSLLMPVLIARMDTTRTVVWFERQVICELRSRIHHFGKSKTNNILWIIMEISNTKLIFLSLWYEPLNTSYPWRMNNEQQASTTFS